MLLSSAKAWLYAFRVKTLTAALVPIACASALVWLQNAEIDNLLVFCLIISALSIQLATNLFNDAIDFKKGADKERVGPKRMTQSGALSPRAVMVMAVGFCVLASVFAIPLVLAGGAVIVAIGLCSIFFAYGYTGGPFPLAYKGWGDFFVVLFFGVIAVSGSAYVLAQEIRLETIILGLQIGFLATVLIAVNNLRDSATDVHVGKKTLAVRFGDSFVQAEILSLILMSYLLQIFWIIKYSWAFSLVYLSLPLALKVVYSVYRVERKPLLNSVLAQSAGLHLIFGFLFCVGCVL